MNAETTSPPFVINREFDAPRDLVFAALTQAKHLSHWLTPPGLEPVEGDMDLRVGGTYHYGMKMPNGQVAYGMWTFREITPPARLVTVVQFSDAERGATRHPMAPNWPLYVLSTITLWELEGKTRLNLELRALNASEVENEAFNSAHGGMSQGWKGSFDQLATYLAAAITKKV